ncbi:MAG: hypothetical protein SFW64_04785 [Alphaproteobacteria bacterium]|nr:hypothetical protein [Alphaproteobacteria bacterium]
MNFFRITFYIVVALSFIGCTFGIVLANGAPQQAAAAAVGVFFIFIPYSITKVLQGNRLVESQKNCEAILKKILEA